MKLTKKQRKELHELLFDLNWDENLYDVLLKKEKKIFKYIEGL